MFFVNDMPHIKLYKQKVLLPIDQKVPTMYSLMFINNNSTDSAAELINSPTLYANGKFHFYYIDNIYAGSILGKHYREVLNKDRETMYKNIKQKVRNIEPETALSSINGRNMYFDLQHYNKIFFEKSVKSIGFKKKAIAYIDFLKGIINDERFEKYPTKTMAVNIDCWMTDAKDKLKSSTTYNNPVYVMYFAMYKMLDKFKELGNIDIIFYSANNMIRVNPSKCDKDSYRLFRTEISKVSSKAALDSDESLDKSVGEDERYAKVINSFIQTYNFTGEDEVNPEFEESIKGRIEEIVEQEDVKELTGKELEDKLSTAIINDEKVLKDVYNITQDAKVGKSTFSIKRDQELRAKQKEIKMNGMKIDDLREVVSRNIPLEKNDVASKIKTTNKNVTTVRYPSFEKSYNQNLLKKDMLNTVAFLNDKQLPVYIRKVDVEDTSDELNLKETYTFELEDGNRVRHKLKFDMPLFIDDKFMYLNGNKKIIIKQLLLKPIVKTGPDEVQICSNYNKIFMRRYGAKVSSKIEKFKKAVSTVKTGVTVKYGNNVAANNAYKTTIEYDDISKDITYLKVANCEFYFNQAEVQNLLKERKLKVDDDELCIGFFIDSKKPITININSQGMSGGDHDWDIIDFILGVEGGKAPGKPSKLQEEFDLASTGKKFMYTKATVMGKNIPLVLLVGFFEGLSTVLRKANIRHSFSDKRPQGLPVDQGVVQFANGYLVYDKYPFENSLLMNAFADIPTKGFNYEDFDDRSAYLDIFDALFNTKILANALINYYDFMIDPITKEVLEDLDYPTDIVGVMLFANALLADNSYIKENNMNLYRVRSNEIINAYLYKAVADAYAQYRSTSNNNNPVKISIPRDAVTKKVLMAQTVEDYSILNPIVELEKSRAITPKGPSGMNLDDAYTQDKRSYDKTMMGLLAMSTSPDANCGIVRQLTLEPNIIGPRGYIDLKDNDLDSLTDANLFSPAELLSPLGVTRDDSIRTAMATKQSKHIIPIEKSSPVLISNGAEQVLHYHLSDDFSVVAKYDGVIKEIDVKTGIAIVEYQDSKGIPQPGGGTKTVLYQAIDINPRTVKNGAGGFFLSNKLALHFKKGEKFKKNDILASDEKFFTQSEVDGNRFNIGSLQKVACMSSYATYEDSTFITKKLSKDMAADIVMQKQIVLGKNANVDYLVKPGDQVTVGDDLIRFEMSFDDDSLNKFLSTIGEELQEEIKAQGKTPVKSKYSGVIEDIKVYSTVDLDDLSPSLKSIVNGYYTKIKQRKKLLDQYDKTESSYKAGLLVNEPTGKIETKDGKVKGNEVGEGVLIEIYIKYRDEMAIGDKITFFTALKSIIGEVTPEGEEPYSEYRPEEEVSSFFAPGAMLARMTPSILLTMFGNKVLVELKRQLQEMATGKPWVPITESAYIDIDGEIVEENASTLSSLVSVNDDSFGWAVE